eukprot:scaffold2847_cov56-Attheya_sp.AAC.5
MSEMQGILQVKSLDYRFVRVERSSETIWWPCLLFPSQDELQQSLSQETTKKEVAILFYKCRLGDVPVAYLLGDHPPVVAHFISSEDEELCDFYSNLAKLGQRYKHDATWCNAQEAAMALVRSDDPTNLGQSGFLDDAPSSPAYSIDTPSPENKKKTVAYEDVTTVPCTTVTIMSSPTSRQKTKTVTQSRNMVEPGSSPESRVSNVEFVGAASSPGSRVSSVEFAKARLEMKLNATDDWITVKDKLQKMGWTILPGKGIVKHYYVHHSLRRMKSYKGLLDQYPDEEGRTWFKSEDSWKKHVKAHCHWEEGAQQKEEQKERTSKQARYLGPHPKNGDSWPEVMTKLNAMGYNWLSSCYIFASPRLRSLNVIKSDLTKNHMDVKGTEWFVDEQEIKAYVTKQYKWNTGTNLGDSFKRAGRGMYNRHKVKGQGGREEKYQSKADEQSIRTSRSTRSLGKPLKGDSWPEVMAKLKAMGYCWLKSGITFVSPRLSTLNVTKSVLKKNHIHLKGIEWFEGEQEIKNYAKKQYKWNAGVSPDNSSKPGFQGLYDRAKSRRRTSTKTPFTKILAKKQPLKKHGRISKKKSPSVISFPKKVGPPTKKRGHEAIEESPSVNSSLSSDSADELVQDGSESEDNIDTQVLVQNMSSLRSSPRKSRQSSVRVDTSSSSTKYVNQLPTFKTVWSILSKHFGFRKVDRERRFLYCLPDVYPDDAETMIGRNYFDEELHLRRHLCAYGLPKPKTELLDEDKEVLEKWVKYAIVPQLRSASKVPTVEPLGVSQAWNMLKKIGFRYSGGKYILPGVLVVKPKGVTSWTKPVRGRDFFERMDGDEGYWKFLARFGIESFPLNNLDGTERLQLELFLTTCPSLDCFEQTEPSEGDPIFVTKSSGRNAIPIDLTSPSKETPFGEGDDGSSHRKAKNTEVPSNQTEEVSDTADIDDEKSPTKPVSPQMGKEFMGEHMMEDNNAIENAQEQNNPAGLPYLTQPETTLEYDDYCELTEDVKTFDEFDSDKITEQELCSTSPQKTEREDKCEHRRQSQYLAAATVDSNVVLESSERTPEKKEKAKRKLDMSPVQKEDDWKIVKQKMISKDWAYRQGRGIVNCYYVRTSNGKEEKYDDYGMQQFAFDHLGWGGDAKFLAEKNDRESNSGTTRQRRHAASVSSVSVLETVNQKKNDTKKTNTSSKRTSDETETQVPEATNTTQSAKRARKEAAPESTMTAPILTFPEVQATVREKLLCCQQVLHPNHACESLAMLDDNDATTRAPCVKQIQSFLENVVSTSGEYGEKPSTGEEGKSPTLYVCGRTGTGKTTAVQTCCGEIIKERESQKGSNRESVPIVCYINVTHIFKANDVTSQSRNEILGRIGTALGMKTDSITTTQIARKMKKIDGSTNMKPVLILILDEIDVIVAETNRDTQELLEELLVWASNPSYSFALIGISNEIQLRRFKALERIAQQITFPTFRKAELTEIIKERVGTSIIDPQAVKFVAATVERNCGDARKAMEVMSEAVGKCMNSLSDEELAAGIIQEPIVKMCHVMQAVKESKLPLNQKITGLPHAAKVVLCVAMEISK